MLVEQRQSQKNGSYSQNGGRKLGTHNDAVGDGNGASATELEPSLWGNAKAPSALDKSAIYYET